MKRRNDIEFKVVELKDGKLTEDADFRYFYVPTLFLDSIMRYPAYTIDQLGNALVKKYGYEKARFALKQISSIFSEVLLDEYEDIKDEYGYKR